MKLFEIKNQTPNWLLVESAVGKNVHLEHLEDLVFNLGHSGAQAALDYIESLRQMLTVGTGSATKLTVKWDGSPAIICGTDPEDGKFFVGTKSVFAKTEQKMNKSQADIDRWYSAQPDLARKLSYALKYLKKLGIGGVVQGDLMFTDEDLVEAEINGKAHYTFTPNTITYAVETTSELGQRIRRAKIGIIFHTAYEGADKVSDMTSGYLPGVQGFNQTSDVWFDDATYKDYTGIVTLSTAENSKLMRLLSATAATLGKISADKFNNAVGHKEFSKYIKPYVNKRVRAGDQISDPTNFIKEFIEYYKAEQLKDVTDPTSKKAQNRLEKIKEKEAWLAENSNTLLAVMAVYKRLIEMKLAIIQKLQTVQGIGTFQKTNDGYKVTTPEGFVALGHDAGAVKLVDRLEFSRANFLRPRD